MIHKLAYVQTKSIGENTTVWQFAIILENAVIGHNCNINCHTFIENEVLLGNNVTVKAGVYLWDGTQVEDDVFIGPNVTFTNDVYPRSKQRPNKFQGALLKKGCSIGAGAIVLGGVTIGEYALIGAGALITKDVPDHALMVGQPALIKGWVNTDGSPMIQDGNVYLDKDGTKWKATENKLSKV